VIWRNRRWLFLVIISLFILPSTVNAAIYKMECREWRSTGDYLGGYIFSFDSGTKSLSIVFKPQAENWLFGTKVKKWILLWEKDLDAVFYGIDDDFTGPVKLLTLKFSTAKLFEYSAGGLAEDHGLVSLTRKECRRLD
jgi:hypothetical protein